MGGRGAGSGAKSFNTGGGTGDGKTKYMDPGKLQNEMTSKSQIGGINTFIDKHANEDHEFYVVINSKGTVIQYNEGQKSSVNGRYRDANGRFYQADKGSIDIHNHPSGIALPSTADLSTWSRTNEITTSFIVGNKTQGMKGNHITRMNKTNNCDQRRFERLIKMVENKTYTATQYAKLLKTNEGKYGYKLKSTYLK